MIRSVIASVLIAGTLGCACQALAAITCATTSAELQAALDAAEANDEADEIRIAVGTYVTPPGGFVYDAESIDGDQAGISLSGGWSVDDSCGQVSDEDPLLTSLDGDGMDRPLQLYVRDSTDVEVRLLTFTGANAASSGGGLWIRASSGHVGTVRIERNAFIANTSGNWGGGLYTTDGIGALHVVNNLFIDNHAVGYHGAASLRRSGGPGIFLVNNTVLDNTSDIAAGGNGVGGIEIVSPGRIVVANNNLWGNDYNDLYVSDSGGELDFVLVSNNFENRAGSDPDIVSGNVSVEPVYEPGLLKFTPVFGSPLVHAGFHPPEDAAWNLTDLDLKNEARVVGPFVDIGAYENPEADLIFVDGFDPASP